MITIDFGLSNFPAGERPGAFEQMTSMLVYRDSDHVHVDRRFLPGRLTPGTEGLLHLPGRVIGWQAKYCPPNTPIPWSDMDDSLSKLHNYYPEVTEFIFSLPRDLTQREQQTFQERLETWQRSYPDLTVRLWAAMELTNKLLINGNETLCRHFFSMGMPLQSDYVRTFDVTKRKLDHRFQAFLNEVGRSQTELAWLGCSSRAQDQLKSSLNELKKAIREQRWWRLPNDNPLRAAGEDAIEQAKQRIQEHTAAWCDAPVHWPLETEISNWQGLHEVISTVSDAIYEEYSHLEEANRKANRNRYSPTDLENSLYSSWRSLLEVANRAGEVLGHLKLALRLRQQDLMIVGEAGIGKSHLLAQLLQEHLNNGAFGLMLLGADFSAALSIEDQFPRLCHFTALPLGDMLDEFQVIAEISGSPFLLIVDAINEVQGSPTVWNRFLRTLRAEIAMRPGIRFAFSLRTSLRQRLDQSNNCLPYYPSGYAELSDKQLDRIRSKFGLAGLGIPLGSPLRDNPLQFLNWCYLEKSGIQPSLNLFSLFDQLITRCEYEESIRDDGKEIDAQLRFAHKFVTRMVTHPDFQRNRFLTYEQVCSITDSLGIAGLASGTNTSAHDRLTNAAILKRDSTYIWEKDRSEVVDGFSFHYDLFADLAIADAMLSAQSTSEQVLQILQDLSHPSIQTGIALYCGEKLDEELPDITEDPVLGDVWLKSLTHRSPESFSEATLRSLYSKIEQDPDTVLLILLRASIGSLNSACCLHDLLITKSVGERDALWTISGLAGRYSRTVSNLLWRVIDACLNQRAAYSPLGEALALTWAFTSSDKALRNRATIALVELCVLHFDLLPKLIAATLTCDDPYVHDRLLAAVYGTLLRLQIVEGDRQLWLSHISQQIADLWLTNSPPTPHILCRDYAMSVVLLACKILPEELRPKVTCSLSNGPWAVEWPLEPLDEEQLAQFEEPEDNELLSGKRARGNSVENILIELAQEGWFDQYKEGLGAIIIEAIPVTPKAKKKQRTSGIGKPQLREEYGPLAFGLSTHRDFFRYIMHGNYGDTDGMKGFSLDREVARRRIFRRALELGWTPERFADIDRRIQREELGRRGVMERISKKYQWIGFFEVIGLADGGASRTSSGYFERPYSGPWHAEVRDFDPSVPMRWLEYSHRCSECRHEMQNCWWAPWDRMLVGLDRANYGEWVDGKGLETLVADTYSNLSDGDGREFFPLFVDEIEWRESEPDFEEQTNIPFAYAKAWVGTFFVDAKKAKFWHNLLKRSVQSQNSLLHQHSDWYRVFAGEFPWHPSWSGIEDAVARPLGLSIGDSRAEVGKAMAGSIAVNVNESLEDLIDGSVLRFPLPAPWIFEGLNLVWDAQKMKWTGKGGTHIEVPGFEKSNLIAGPLALLANREILRWASETGMTALLVVSGERRVYWPDLRGPTDRKQWGKYFGTVRILQG